MGKDGALGWGVVRSIVHLSPDSILTSADDSGYNFMTDATLLHASSKVGASMADCSWF